MNNLFFYVPFGYSMHTRLNNTMSLIAWVFTYVIPYHIVFIKVLETNMLISFISILCVYCVYEYGYIVNDAELIKKELNPTLRLSEEELRFYELNVINIIIVRVVIYFFLSCMIFFYDGGFFLSVLIATILIFIVFTIYNRVRNRITIPLYSILVFLRYFGVFILFFDTVSLCYLWIIYPLCVTLEFASKEKFALSIPFMWLGYDRFRVFYYFILFIALVLLPYAVKFDIHFAFGVLLVYMMLYRLSSLLFLSRIYRG